MPIIDERGRVFGRINLIDLVVLLFVIVLLPIGYAAYRLFQTPPPQPTAVEPSSMVVQPKVEFRIKVKGRDLRPFLNLRLFGMLRNQLFERTDSSSKVFRVHQLKGGLVCLDGVGETL